MKRLDSDKGGTVSLMEETLTDGSLVYGVTVYDTDKFGGTSIHIPCRTQKCAKALFKAVIDNAV